MFKFVILAMFVCAANAGIIGAGYGHGLVAAPVAVAHAPVASSYQNSNSISLHPTAVVAAHAAPVAVAHAAPIAVAHAAPVAVVSHGLAYGGHGLAYGGHGLAYGGHGLLH